MGGIIQETRAASNRYAWAASQEPAIARGLGPLRDLQAFQGRGKWLDIFHLRLALTLSCRLGALRSVRPQARGRGLLRVAELTALGASSLQLYYLMQDLQGFRFFLPFAEIGFFMINERRRFDRMDPINSRLQLGGITDRSVVNRSQFF